jgi:hypothetical protein
MPCICCVNTIHILTICFVRDMTQPQISILCSWSSNISACLDRLPIRRGSILLLSTCTVAAIPCCSSSHPLSGLQILVTMRLSWMCLQDLTRQDPGVLPHSIEFWSERNQHSHLPVSRVRVRSVLRARGYARQALPIQHGTQLISGKKCQGEYIYMVYVLYITCICRSYSWYIHVLTWLCSLQDG